MLGISTCWWYGRADRGDEIVRDILELGLRGVELEYRIPVSIYHQMRPLLNKDLKVLSIHNYFPKPEEARSVKGSGDLFLHSSTDRDERLRALKYTTRTIELAHDLEVEAVILHLGIIDMPDQTPTASDIYQTLKRDGSEGQCLVDEQRQIREARHQKHLDAVLRNLEKLNREAERKGVFLGIENRFNFWEIPDFQEIGLILKEFQGGHLRYWHDIGHAQAQENTGFIQQKDLLEAYSEMMLGFHFHDVIGVDDHLAPGQGDVDFETIKPFLKPSHIKILEIHPEVEKNDLMDGIRFIESIGIE